MGGIRRVAAGRVRTEWRHRDGLDDRAGSDWARRVPATAVVLLGLAAVAVTVHAGVAAARSTPGPTGTSATPGAVVPYQYVTKAYTELLGRAPTPAEWSAVVASFQGQGCTATPLIQLGDTIVASTEYQHDYPDTDAGSRALTLYRFVLNREPTFWEQYKRYIVLGIFLLSTQALIILGLLAGLIAVVVARIIISGVC